MRGDERYTDEDGHEYVAGDELGRGLLTTVYAARRIGCDANYAIKTVLPLWIGHPLAEARIFREREVSQCLLNDLPRILSGGHQAIEPGRFRPFHVSRHMTGRTLAEALLVPIPTFQERVHFTLTWAYEILRSVANLHAHNWVHRDVKSQNVFLENGSRAVLIDFGLAVPIGTFFSNTDEPLGTPAYLAPEVIRGEQLDGRTDLYSIGLLLYESLLGRRPFFGLDPVQLLEAQLSLAIPSIREHCPQMSGPLAEVISASVQKSPTNRPPSAAALIELLRATPEGVG